MNERERFIATQLFGTPDRVPFDPGGPRRSTIRAWREQGLPADVPWSDFLYETIGIDPPARSEAPSFDINFKMIPEFEEKVIERRPGSLIVQDWKGNVCEISDEFDVTYLRNPVDFVTRRWIACPVANRDDWESMKERYDSSDPARFPGNLAERARKLSDRQHVLTLNIPGVFWQMREWLGFEELCMRFLTEPDLVGDMASFWSDFVAALLKKSVGHIAPDYVIISEDMAYKEKIMISPALTREYILPAWKRWGKILEGAGCPVYGMDSDGYVGSLVPLWIEAGFQTCWPVEVAAGNDLPRLREEFGHQMAYGGGIDKREIARGGRAIRREIRRIEPVVRDGGYVPGCDHGIPPDVSWPAMVKYSRLLAEVTGWK